MHPGEPDSPPVDPGEPPRPAIFDRPYSFDAAWSEGWALFKASYGLLLAMVAINLGVGFAVGIPCAVIDAIAAPVGTILSYFAQFFVQTPLWVGCFFFAVRLARGESPPFDACLDGFRRYADVILVLVINVLIFVGIAAIPGAVIVMIAASGTGSSVGMAVVIVAVVILALASIVILSRLMFASAIILDPRWNPVPADAGAGSLALRAGAWDRAVAAIKNSWTITGLSPASVVVLVLAAGLMVALTVLLLCIGVILLGQPLYLAVMTCAYVMLAEPFLGGYCRVCGYPIEGVPGLVCPECGTPR